METAEKVRWGEEFRPAQVSPGSMKTKSSCEKGRDLDPHRVEAPIDDGLMTCRYLMELRKRALIRSIPHQMVLNLERLGLLRRTPGQPRSLHVLVAPTDLPPLE